MFHSSITWLNSTLLPGTSVDRLNVQLLLWLSSLVTCIIGLVPFVRQVYRINKGSPINPRHNQSDKRRLLGASNVWQRTVKKPRHKQTNTHLLCELNVRHRLYWTLILICPRKESKQRLDKINTHLQTESNAWPRQEWTRLVATLPP